MYFIDAKFENKQFKPVNYFANTCILGWVRLCVFPYTGQLHQQDVNRHCDNNDVNIVQRFCFYKTASLKEEPDISTDRKEQPNISTVTVIFTNTVCCSPRVWGL